MLLQVNLVLKLMQHVEKVKLGLVKLVIKLEELMKQQLILLLLLKIKIVLLLVKILLQDLKPLLIGQVLVNQLKIKQFMFVRVQHNVNMLQFKHLILMMQPKLKLVMVLIQKLGLVKLVMVMVVFVQKLIKLKKMKLLLLQMLLKLLPLQIL